MFAHEQEAESDKDVEESRPASTEATVACNGKPNDFDRRSAALEFDPPFGAPGSHVAKGNRHCTQAGNPTVTGSAGTMCARDKTIMKGESKNYASEAKTWRDRITDLIHTSAKPDSRS